MPVITDLPAIVAGLPEERRARFERIFKVQLDEGRCVLPETMYAWTRERFGPLEAVERQQIVRVTNTVTWEGALFNPLRARRPMLRRNDGRPALSLPKGRRMNDDGQTTTGASSPSSFDLRHSSSPQEDVFADPLRTTAADPFGRVRGQHCITTGNVARWDAQCSVLIFDEPDPLAFTREQLRDYFRTALEWAHRAHAADPQARYLVWSWNGGTAGGASIPHAHAQMGLGRHSHYAMVEGLRRAALDYRARHDSDYYADLIAAHQDMGLGFDTAGLTGFVSLTACRARDTWIIGRAFDDALAGALHDVLRAYVKAGLQSFDVGILMPPPFGPADPAEDWSGFPTLARVVDRGPADALSSDVGAMDLFAQRVISVDPYAAWTEVNSNE
jgi:hypothetical protein